MFVNEFLDWFPDQLIQYKNIIIVGDINLHLNDSLDVEAGAFMDNIEAVGLYFHNKFATHKAGNTLDIFITEESGNLRIDSCRPGPFLLGLCNVEVTLDIPRSEVVRKHISFRCLKDIDKVAFGTEVMNHPLLKCDPNNTNLDNLVERLETALSESLDVHAPKVDKTINVRRRCPWFTDEIKNQKQFLRRCDKIWHKYQQDHQWVVHKAEKGKYNQLL